MEQTGLSLLCEGQEPSAEQGHRVRGEEHSGGTQDTGPIRTCT